MFPLRHYGKIANLWVDVFFIAPEKSINFSRIAEQLSLYDINNRISRMMRSLQLSEGDHKYLNILPEKINI
jgi:hypothetical protein